MLKNGQNYIMWMAILLRNWKRRFFWPISEGDIWYCVPLIAIHDFISDWPINIINYWFFKIIITIIFIIILVFFSGAKYWSDNVRPVLAFATRLYRAGYCWQSHNIHDFLNIRTSHSMRWPISQDIGSNKCLYKPNIYGLSLQWRHDFWLIYCDILSIFGVPGECLESFPCFLGHQFNLLTKEMGAWIIIVQWETGCQCTCFYFNGNVWVVSGGILSSVSQNEVSYLNFFIKCDFM